MLRFDAIPLAVRDLLEPIETVDGIRLTAVADAAAMKLNAIANRGSKKDFFDLCQLAEIHPLSRMLEWFERKYPNSDRFIVLRSLAWFDDAELEPDPVSLAGLSWQEAKHRVEHLLREIH